LLTIAELPFVERPATELLGFVNGRAELDRDYAGYGWARVDRLWLSEPARESRVDDALVLALHSPDDAAPIAGDIELELELPHGGSVLVMLSKFLATWLPKLPEAPAYVLALCNPTGATIGAGAGAPLWYAGGDVESWIDPDSRLLLAADSWKKVEA
jgi:hypothetical protein